MGFADRGPRSAFATCSDRRDADCCRRPRSSRFFSGSAKRPDDSPNNRQAALETELGAACMKACRSRPEREDRPPPAGEQLARWRTRENGFSDRITDDAYPHCQAMFDCHCRRERCYLGACAGGEQRSAPRPAAAVQIPTATCRSCADCLERGDGCSPAEPQGWPKGAVTRSADASDLGQCAGRCDRQ